MKKRILFMALLVGCTSNHDTLRFECEEQNSGEACLRLARKDPGKRHYLLRGCELGSTESCNSLATAGSPSEREAALKGLSQACGQGNAKACEAAKSLPE
jgi:hypothetical protein